MASGFGTIVLVIGPHTGPAIRYHVERMWPSGVDARFALQRAPLGTVDAVLAAEEHLGDEESFAVANADDLYGREALSVLADHLMRGEPSHALVGFRLRNSVIGSGPVTRGIVQGDGQGWLEAIEERRKVQAAPSGRFDIHDGRQPAVVEGDELVSLNLWGFRPSIRKMFRVAMDEAIDASENAEVLLPEVVASIVADHAGAGDPAGRFRVLTTESRCIGVTHPEDLALVQEAVANEVARGDRSAVLWTND